MLLLAKWCCVVCPRHFVAPVLALSLPLLLLLRVSLLWLLSARDKEECATAAAAQQQRQHSSKWQVIQQQVVRVGISRQGGRAHIIISVFRASGRHKIFLLRRKTPALYYLSLDVEA